MMEYLHVIHDVEWFVSCSLSIIIFIIRICSSSFFKTHRERTTCITRVRETNNVLINETYLVHFNSLLKNQIILCLFFLRMMKVVKAQTYWIELSWTNSVRSTEQTCPRWLFLAYSYHVDQKFRIHMITFNKGDREIVLLARSCISCCSKKN